MTTLHITEASTVQMPMVRHAAEVGWVPVPPQEALARRGADRPGCCSGVNWRRPCTASILG